jgi:hypothetical protein
MAKLLEATFTSMLIVCLIGFSVQAAPPKPSAGQLTPAQPAPHPPVGKPDLVVDLSLVTEKYTDPNAGGITCYNVTPQYTITNRGQGVAADFRTKMECKPGPGQDWQVWADHPPKRLNPGESFTQGPVPTARTKWCEGYGSKSVGFRVTADHGGSVTESNEDNNRATKLFPSIGQLPSGLRPEQMQKGAK